MHTIIKKLLITLIILIYCTYAGFLWAQETAKTEGDSAKDTTAPLLVAIEPRRLPGRQPRLQFPNNDGSDKSQMEALAEQISVGLSPRLPEDALVWLETPTKNKFLALWRPDRSGNPRGALLIVHSEGEHLAWPDTIRPLHASLPDHGWATLAVSLPDPANPQIPKRTLPLKSQSQPSGDELANNTDDPEAKEKSDTIIADKTAAGPSKNTPKNSLTTANSQPAETAENRPPEEITEQRLATALRFLHDKGQFNIVILGSGTGAIRANTFLNNTTPKIDNPDLGAAKPFSGIILLNSRNRLPTMEQDYTEWFADPGIPVLDIFLSKDLRNFKAAKARKIVAKQKKVVLYKQVKLNHLTATSVAQENLLSRRIRSYLSANLEGIETSAFKKNTVN
jgi:hypothetical protein